MLRIPRLHTTSPSAHPSDTQARMQKHKLRAWWRCRTSPSARTHARTHTHSHAQRCPYLRAPRPPHRARTHTHAGAQRCPYLRALRLPHRARTHTHAGAQRCPYLRVPRLPHRARGAQRRQHRLRHQQHVRVLRVGAAVHAAKRAGRSKQRGAAASGVARRLQQRPPAQEVSDAALRLH